MLTKKSGFFSRWQCHIARVVTEIFLTRGFENQGFLECGPASLCNYAETITEAGSFFSHEGSKARRKLDAGCVDYAGNFAVENKRGLGRIISQFKRRKEKGL